MKKITFSIVVLMITFSTKSLFSQLSNESFEGSFPPSGWTVAGGNGVTNDKWFRALSSMHVQVHNTGQAGAASESFLYPNPVTPNNWLITPQISINNYDSLIFHVKPSSVQFPAENLEVWVSTGNNNMTDFTTRLYQQTFTASDAAQHNRKAISLAAWQGQTIYIAFAHKDCTGQDMLFLDDVSTVAGATNTKINQSSVSTVNFIQKQNNIFFYGAYQIQNVKIFNVLGSLMIEKNTLTEYEKIDLSSVNNGIYIATWTQNNIQFSKKINIIK